MFSYVFHSWHAEQLLFSSLCSKVTLTLSHSNTLSISHSLTLDKLNNYCFHVFAQTPLSHSFNLTFTLSFTQSQHAEQLLSSCLCSKVTDYRLKWQCFFYHLQQHTRHDEIPGGGLWHIQSHFGAREKENGRSKFEWTTVNFTLSWLFTVLKSVRICAIQKRRTWNPGQSQQ